MTNPGDTERLPSLSEIPSASEQPGPAQTSPRTIDEHAPWLTESAYAWPNALAQDASGSGRRTGKATWVKRIVLLCVALIPLGIFFTGAAVVWTARTAEPHQADAIVVMGAAQYNGRPSNVFEARLEYALELYEDGYAPLIVVTGGKMPGDAYSEGETAANYFLEHGVPDSAIVGEFEGRDTWESMQGIVEVLEGTDVQSLLIVSDGFHLLRSQMMAEDLGFEASGAAAPDSPIRPWSGAELSYVIRETGGILVLLPTLVGLGFVPVRP